MLVDASKENVPNTLGVRSARLFRPCFVASPFRKIFWTEQGVRPKIESANLDGSNRTVLVIDELDWPNGIAVDHENGWVYWCDTKKSTVETVSVNGKGRTIVQRFNGKAPNCFLDTSSFHSVM